MSKSYYDRRELYYITHVANLPSILDKGILSHSIVMGQSIDHTPVYDNRIVVNRSEILTPNGDSLWEYANLYITARNPMLYRVVAEIGPNDIAVISIDGALMNRDDVFITTGNAASSYSEIRPASQIEKTLRELKSDLDKEYWSFDDGSKRRIMAEILIPERVTPDNIKSIYVANYNARLRVLKLIGSSRLPVIPEPNLFFQPSRQVELTDTLSLVDGDMFFSRWQTITISVNCVGVMGKGIASRAKYQFPDVYVYYQDLCRQRKLRLGRPYLYKRESSFDMEIADEPDSMTRANHETWFLLFATKGHWRQDADKDGIEKGLQWIVKNYEKVGIKSLAIPALGCGLGNLDWAEIGPLMCLELSKLKIPVRIYLPLERRIPDEQLTKEYLLG